MYTLHSQITEMGPVVNSESAFRAIKCNASMRDQFSPGNEDIWEGTVCNWGGADHICPRALERMVGTQLCVWLPGMTPGQLVQPCLWLLCCTHFFRSCHLFWDFVPLSVTSLYQHILLVSPKGSGPPSAALCAQRGPHLLYMTGPSPTEQGSSWFRPPSHLTLWVVQEA